MCTCVNNLRMRKVKWCVSWWRRLQGSAGERRVGTDRISNNDEGIFKCLEREWESSSLTYNLNGVLRGLRSRKTYGGVGENRNRVKHVR